MKSNRFILLLAVFFLLFSLPPYTADTVYTVFASSENSAVSEDIPADNNPESERNSSAAAQNVSLTFSSQQLPNERFLALQIRSVKWHYTFNQDIRISVTASQPVSQLYFQFEKPCDWSLTLPDGTVKQGGQYRSIHEYVDLGESVSDFSVDLHTGAVFTGLFAFTEGETPAWVQKWLPPCETADLLVLPTHADDEFLWFGGALPYYAGELGYNVQVVFLTNHYNNSFREHERLNALWTVGVRHYPVVCEQFTDWVTTKRYDWAVDALGYDNVLAYQVETLRRFKPKVVLGHDINGEYGHGMHILNAKTLLDALKLTNDPSAFPQSSEKYGLCSVQKCYLHLWEENQILVKWENIPLSKFGNISAAAMADKGFAQHESQFKYYAPPSVFGLYDCRKFGLAYTTVGYDTPGLNDMFEHVDLSEATHDSSISSHDEIPVSEADVIPDRPEEPGTAGTVVGLPMIPLIAGGGVLGIAAAIGLLWGIIHHQKKKSKVNDS